MFFFLFGLLSVWCRKEGYYTAQWYICEFVTVITNELDADKDHSLNLRCSYTSALHTDILINNLFTLSIVFREMS